MAKKKTTYPFTVILEDTEKIPRRVWLKERKLAVCASDYPAIVGLSGFKTPVDIYEDKVDSEKVSEEVSLETKYRFDIGHALEPVMLETIGREIGAVPIRDKRMVESTLYPYMRADIDGLFLMKQDRVICGTELQKNEMVLFEAKTTSFSKYMEYREQPDPAHVAQSKFGMLVRGLKHCIIGYSCGGNNLSTDLTYHLCELTEEDEETIPLVVKDFWEEHVLKQIPPSQALGPHASEFKKALIRHYGKTARNDGNVLKFPVHMAEILRQSIAVRQEISELNAIIKSKEAQRDSIELPLVNMLGDQYQSGELNSIYLSYKAGFSSTERKTLSAENMERLQKEHPEVYQMLIDEAYITTSVSRTFNVRSKAKKAKTRRKRGA